MRARPAPTDTDESPRVGQPGSGMHTLSPERPPGAARRFLLVGLHSPQRWSLALAATVTAGAHIPIIAPHLAEAPYMGTLFIVLTVACVALAAAAVVRDSVAVYALSMLTCGSAIIGYAATRLVAFPMLGDEVGNWLEPLGVVAVTAEALVVWSAATVLVASRRELARS